MFLRLNVLECGVGTIRSAFDALIEQLWEKRSDGLTYKQAIACLNTCLPEQESSSMLHQLQRMGLFTHEHPVCFTEQERPIAERLFAKWLGKQQQNEDDLAGTLQPETDTGVITAFLRGVATDPVAWAERLVAQEDSWLPAVTAGLAQGSPADYRSLALLTTLARPKSRAIVGFEACTALGQLASRGERAWKWVAQMYVGGREEERYRGEAALATAMGTAPYRVGAAIRLRLSRIEKLDRGQRERVLKDTLTPLLGINHRVAADVGRRILQRYSYLAENDWQRPNESFLETVDHARGLIASVNGEVGNLLAQLRSDDPFIRFRTASALQPVVVEQPELVQGDLFQALRLEKDPRVMSRLLQTAYRFSTTAPDTLLDALEECFVLRWDQAFRSATGMALVVLSALAADKQYSERVFRLLPQHPDTFEPWARALFSEVLAFTYWGCAECVPQAYPLLSALTQPDLTILQDKFRPFALRGAVVARLGVMCLSMGETRARGLVHPKRVAAYFWVDTDEFAKHYAEPLLARPDYARLLELLLACLHEGQRVHASPIDPLSKEQNLCALFCLEMVVQLAIKLTDPLPLLHALPPDWPILHVTRRLLEAGHTDPPVVQLAQDLCTRYANGATVQAYDERERCLSQLAQLKGDSHVALEEHRTAQWHPLLKMNGDAHVLAELTDSHPERMLSLLQQSLQSEADLPTLYHWEEEARSWQGLLIARVYARMFDARPIRLIEARALCDQMLTAIHSLPVSPEQQEYEAIYGTIAAWLVGNRQPTPVLPAPHSLVHISHTYATSLLQQAYEERPAEADRHWIADACANQEGGLESSQFGIDDVPLVSVFGRFMRCVLPAVRLACVAIGQGIGLSDPAGRWLLERAQVDQLFLDYSWTRDTSVYQGNEQLLEEACTAFLASATSIPHDERLLQRCGALLIACNDHAQAEEILRRCLSLPARDQQARTEALYDLARMYAKKGQEVQCRDVLQALSCQFPAGQLPWEQLSMDPDFTAMQNKPWFHELGTEVGEDQCERERP